jgi:cytochrome c
MEFAVRAIVLGLLSSLYLAACSEAPRPADTDAVLEAFGAPYTQANLSHGAELWASCQACHSLKADEAHRVGPNLHGLFGRHAGAAEGFRYSEALDSAGFVWTPDQLDAWLSNPRGFLPGNRMTFSGLRQAEDRRDLIAYLAVETAPEA